MSTSAHPLEHRRVPVAQIKANPAVALAGNPNCGKTTIFNALTGLRQKVANYPGVTVEKKTGRTNLPDGRTATVIDLPGTYSLISRSPDEVVAMEVLRGLRADTPAPDAVVVVVDASNLQRNLYLVSQLLELGRPMVVALNMMDVARRRGIDVSPEKLEQELGVPVVPVVGHKRDGIEDLKAAVVRARVGKMPEWPLSDVIKHELATVSRGLAELHPQAPSARDSGLNPPDYRALAERLLIGDHARDLGEIATSDSVRTIVAASRDRLATHGIDPMQADIEAHYRWIEGVAQRVTTLGEPPASGDGGPAKGKLDYADAKLGKAKRQHLSERVDAVLIHKVWGLLIFALIMATLFVTIFWLAKPIMDGISGGIEAAGAWVAGMMSEGPLRDLVKDGIFAGVGSVIVFVPQIAILFLFLGVLEDSGYLARAAFMMDRLLHKVGLHGKSFIPLLSSFACAIPGIMATRTIEDRKSRLATIMVAPFMSCSARLPVYTLLIGTFFAGYGALTQTGVMLALYALGIVAAAVTAWCFKRTLLKGPPPAFILELPTYKVPQLSQVARHVWTNTWAFLARAGTIIFVLSVILWALMYYPGPSDAGKAAATVKGQAEHKAAAEEYDAKQSQAKAKGQELTDEKGKPIEAPKEDDFVEKAVGGERLRTSIAGRFGHLIEPVIRPLGYDWKMGVGLVGAFAAREMFVGTMGIVYSVGDPGDETGDLVAQMRADTYDAGPRKGQPVWTIPVALSLLVWFVLAMQCISTVAIVKRETGGWRWPVFMILYMNALAYVAALGVYQVARLVA
ncbi:MAG TPA: ferrous iron transport protein B [Tepidisphaeraceae bacterium]|nr:ferrous iron transport protein B [Tepidisphaeraceae bacterium]